MSTLLVEKFIAKLGTEFMIDKNAMISLWESTAQSNASDSEYKDNIKANLRNMINTLPQRNLTSEPWPEMMTKIGEEITSVETGQFRCERFGQIRAGYMNGLRIYDVCSTGGSRFSYESCIDLMNNCILARNNQGYINTIPLIQLAVSPEEENIIFRFNTCRGKGNAWMKFQWDNLLQLSREDLVLLMEHLHFLSGKYINVEPQEMVSDLRNWLATL